MAPNPHQTQTNFVVTPPPPGELKPEPGPVSDDFLAFQQAQKARAESRRRKKAEPLAYDPSQQFDILLSRELSANTDI